MLESDRESYKRILDEMNLTPAQEIEPTEAVHRILEQVDLDAMCANYILVDKKPVRVGLIEWSAQMVNWQERVVERTMIGNILISTVFLGIVHGLTENGEPLLFETMTFDFAENIMFRYPTWELAQAGHHKTVHYVKQYLKRKG